MNDPNEGIETCEPFLPAALPLIIEMNDPNEGIETRFYPFQGLFLSFL